MFTNIPIKHAGSNSEAFWLRPTCSRNQAGLYMPDPTSRIQFGSVFFQRRPGSNCAKPTRIRSGWPLQVWGKHIVFTSKPVYKNHQAWFWQKATGPLPVSHFQTRLRSSTDGPDHTVQYQPGSDLVLSDCQILAKRIRSGGKPVYKNHQARFWPTLPSRAVSDPACVLGICFRWCSVHRFSVK